MSKKTMIELVGTFGQRLDDGWIFSDAGLEKFVDSLSSAEKTNNTMDLAGLVLAVASSDADLHLIYYKTDFEAVSVEKFFNSHFTILTKFTPVIKHLAWTTPPNEFLLGLNNFIDRRCNVLMLPFVYLEMNWRIAPHNPHTLIQNYFTFDPTPEQTEAAFQHVHTFANGLPNVVLGDV